MSSNYEYILSLQDRVSGTMQRITGSSSEAMHKFTQLNDKTKALQRTTGDFGNSITSLRSKINLLQSERDIIDPKNLTTIRQYNSEIKRLGKELNRLETINGSALKNWSKDLVSQIPPIFKNPLVLGAAAIGFAGKSAIGFDESMAKVNITAQLDKQGEAQLRTQLKAIASRNGADLAVVPVGFEKIISQVAEVAPSLEILDAALRGSKAGFTDTDTVAGALAQTLSIVGSKNASAAEVLDTFFAAKRVGAGEFKDFANYMPSLVASADALGIKYKEVAGVFSYMTGKGQSAERASVLMNNMFSILGRGKVQEGLSLQGIDIFDDSGKMRDMLSIFRDVQKVMGDMTDEQKSGFLEDADIRDKEAKSAFMVMAADTDKLKLSLDACSAAAGETDKALEFSANAAQRSTELWNKFKNTGLEIGEKMLPMIGGGLSLLNILLDGGVGILNAVGSATSFWAEALSDGNPLIWAMTTAVGAGTAMWAAHTIQLKAVSIWQTLTKAGTKSLTWSMGVLKGVMTALKTAWLTTPWGIAIAGIAAIGGAVYGLMSKTSKATETFASFNAELRRNKAETSDVFTAAQKAAAGSQERAKAIQAINDKYGEYLPYLLAETASNNEIAAALSRVNLQLEQKLRLKFRDQAKEEIMSDLNDAEDKLFKSVFKGADNDTQVQLAEVLRTQMSLFEQGKVDRDDIYTAIRDAGANRWQMSGQLNAIEVWMSALESTSSQLKLIDYRFNSGPQAQNIEVNNTIDIPLPIQVHIPAAEPYQPTTPQWASKPQQPLFPQGPAPAAPPTTPAAVKQTTNIQPKITTVAPKDYGGGGHSSFGGTQSQVIKLDTLPAADLAGSGAYNAIQAKIMPRKLPAMLAAAASLAMPMAVMPDSATVPDIGASAAIETSAPDRTMEPTRRTVSMTRFCDQLTINITHADGKGYDQIKDEVMAAITEAINIG